MAKIRVLVVDDHAILRAGLRALINAQPDLEVVGEAGNTWDALILVRSLRPHVMTLDLALPGGGALKMVEQLRQEVPETRVLVLTMHDDPVYARAVLATGCSGYLVKTVADTELFTAIRTVHQGRPFVSLKLHRANQALPSNRPDGAHELLSQRERQILTYLVQGHTNREIAERLFLSVKTIETYRLRLGKKLGLQKRADFVRYALETGLLKEFREE